MESPVDPVLQRIKQAVSAAAWDERVCEAQRQAEALDRIEALVAAGRSERGAIGEVAPGEPVSTWRDRRKRYRAGGSEGLVSRRWVRRPEKVTPKVVGLVQGLLLADPDLRLETLCEEVEKRTGVRLAESTMRQLLRREGLSRAPGRPRGRTKAEPLPLAGAELLKAVEVEIGAVSRLTRDIEASLEALPEPVGIVLDDQANRDEHGRFLTAYNEGQERGRAPIGPKFETVEIRRQGKDLPRMRAATSSTGSLYQKNLALTFLPCVTDGARLSALRHWRGAHLGPLVGYPYQPTTLTKYLGELKFAGLAEKARNSVASFWMNQEGPVVDPLTGAIVLYGDAAVKPIWTQQFTRCAKVSTLGRVMPASSTVYLHSGCGTPLIYRTFSGTVSVPGEVPHLLREYEEIAGEGTARRLIVLDRESHAVWLFKELAEDWLYIVPLCSNVVGPKAKFKDLTEWTAYGEKGDMVCDGQLWLNDSRKGETGMWSRVVGRQRHRTGKVAWYATNSKADEFGPAHVIDLYFDRWPLQEHVFRAGNGRVGLDKHHGFGKKLVDNVAVLDKIEKLDGRIRKNEAIDVQATSAASRVQEVAEIQCNAVEKVEDRVDELRSAVDEDVASGNTATGGFEERYRMLRSWEEWLRPARDKAEKLTTTQAGLEAKSEQARATCEAARQEREKLSCRTRIFAVDTELDQVMTAFKLTFMSLCAYFLAHYFGGRKMELDTLIEAVLTLPGQRVLTPATETVHIWRQPRDPEIMPLVEEACRLLTAKRLMHDQRRLIFEVTDPPAT